MLLTPKKKDPSRILRKSVSFSDDSSNSFSRTPSAEGEHRNKYSGFACMGRDSNRERLKCTIRGLYAIVIPAGGGKSTLSSKFGQLDIDRILADDVENGIRELRDSAFREGNARERDLLWDKHNKLWGDTCYKCLYKYNFESDPRILFCHSDVIAKDCGAELLAILVPSDDLHEYNIRESNRTGGARSLCYENKSLLIKTCSHSSLYHEYNTHNELERIVAELIVNRVVCPYVGNVLKYDEAMLSPTYQKAFQGCPRRVVEGDILVDDIDGLIDLCCKGSAPWWVVSTWCQKFTPDLNIDGGTYHDIYNWTKLSSTIDQHVYSVNTDTITYRMLGDGTINWYKFFPYSEKVHQTRANIRLKKLLKMVTHEMSGLVLKIMNCHIGAEHSFICCIIGFVIGVFPTLSIPVQHAIMDSNILMVAEYAWVRVHNDVHKYVRASQEFFGIPLTNEEYSKLQYTAALFGRRVYKLDAEAEIAKRAVFKLNDKRGFNYGKSEDDYWTMFKEGVERAYVRLGTNFKRGWRDVNDFWEQRYAWATGGSITNLPEDMKELKEVVELIVEIKDEIKRLYVDASKKVALERIKNCGELAWYLKEHWGYNKTRLANKPNEPAKNRVLIPGSFLHYLVMSYILGNVERTGTVGGVRVGDSDDMHMSNFDMRIGMNAYNFMLDFADHNAQHSVPEMQYIIAALESAMIKKGCAHDIIWFVNWLVDSFENMIIIDNENIESKINSGLFTGWRGTTWINSIACQAYVNVGLDIARLRYGKIELISFEGAGDDVLTEFTSTMEAIKFYRCMELAGFEMQSIKQMFSHRRTEFLRQITCDRKMYTCINRVLPNFISGDLERSNPTILSRALGAFSVCQMMIRRGLVPEVGNGLYVIYLDRWLKITTNNTTVNVSKCVLHGRIEDNGLGLPDEYGHVWYLESRLERPIMRKPVIKNGPDHATQDYINFLSRELLRLGIRIIRPDSLLEHLKSDVFSINSKIDQISLEDPTWVRYLTSKVRMVSAVEQNYKYDEGALSQFLNSVGRPDVDKVLNDYYSVCKYKAILPFTDCDLNLYCMKLGMDQNTFFQMDELQLSASVAFSVPEYILHNVIRYGRYMIWWASWDVTRARLECENICYTYNWVFKHNI